MMPVRVAGPDWDIECDPRQNDKSECDFCNWGLSWIFVKQAYFFEAIATTEHIFPDAGDGVWYLYARQASATIERTFPDAGDGVWYLYARKAGATIERRIPDAGDGVRYLYARQTGATLERIILNFRNARWYESLIPLNIFQILFKHD